MACERTARPNCAARGDNLDTDAATVTREAPGMSAFALEDGVGTSSIAATISLRVNSRRYSHKNYAMLSLPALAPLW